LPTDAAPTASVFIPGPPTRNDSMMQSPARRAAPIAAAVLAAAVAILPGCSGAPSRATPAVTSRYTFLPALPTEPRIQFVSGYAFAEDVQDPSSRKGLERILLGEQGEQDTSIQKPYGVAALNGRIYVCDIRAGGVVILDLARRQARLIGMTGSQRM